MARVSFLHLHQGIAGRVGPREDATSVGESPGDPRVWPRLLCSWVSRVQLLCVSAPLCLGILGVCTHAGTRCVHVNSHTHTHTHTSAYRVSKHRSRCDLPEVLCWAEAWNLCSAENPQGPFLSLLITPSACIGAFVLSSGLFWPLRRDRGTYREGLQFDITELELHLPDQPGQARGEICVYRGGGRSKEKPAKKTEK